MQGASAIYDLLTRATKLRDNLANGKIMMDIIANNQHYIIDMNAYDQLYDEGVNRCGVSIMDYMPYAPLTIEIKTAKGQPTDRVTLRDEGDFYKSMWVDIGNDKFEIKAADFKTEHLIKKYGRQILGLTNENLKSLIWQYIYPDLIEQTKNYLLK